MSFALRKLSGTAALVVVASALTLPFATPAHAVSATEKAFVIESVNGDYWTGLYTRPTPAGARTTVVADPGSHHIYSMSGSRDGSRVIYGQINYSTTTGEALSRQIIVRDVSTRLVRVLDTERYSPDWSISNPQLSPDGTRAVWDLHHQGDYNPTYLRTAEVGAGAFTTWKAGFSPYAFLDQDTLLVQTGPGVPYTVPFAGGAAHSVGGLPIDAFNVAVSPDGSQVAYALYGSNSTNELTRSSTNVAALTFAGGVASVGTATQLSSGAAEQNPSFSRDGAKVYFVRWDGTPTGPGDIWVAPANASTAAAVTVATASDERDVVITSSDDGTAPGEAGATVPFTLGGTTATIRWTLPTDPDLSGVLVKRAGKPDVYVPAPQTSLTVSGLTIGTVSTVTITAVDRSNNQAVTGASRQLRAIAAGAYFGNPTSTYSTKTAFPVRFATGGDAATTKYFVKYLPYGGSLKAWVSGETGATRTFGVAGNGSTVTATTALAGGNYNFAVRAEDEFGNSTPNVVSPRSVVPFDQSKATFSGASVVASSAAYLGSFRRMTSTSAYAKVTLVGDRLQIVGRRCPSCGSFAIFDGATKIGTVSTYASSSRARTVLFTKTYTGNATHTFTIRPLGTAGHPAVELDGFAMRRK